VRDASEYFDDIQDVKITKDMLDLAKHLVEQKSGHFEPQKFEEHYETALAELLAKKQQGLPIGAARKPAPSNVVNLMDALRASLASSGKGAPAAKLAKAPAKKTAKPKPRPADMRRRVYPRQDVPAKPDWLHEIESGGYSLKFRISVRRFHHAYRTTPFPA